MRARLIASLFFAVPLAAAAAPVHLVRQSPVSITRLPSGAYLLDYGRDAFGNLLLNPPSGVTVTVRFGESLLDGRIDQTPPGSVRYAQITLPLHPGPQAVAPPAPRMRAAHPVLTPAAWGVVLPFRWVEIDHWPGPLRRSQVLRRAAFDPTWNPTAATFHSSDPMLDQVWQLCHYSIQAATFAGVFVDGDRERTSYEADAYISQLGYYAGDPNPQFVRDTFARLMQFPTWPSEWAPHMVFIAYADWLQTGDKAWLAAHYDFLKTKLLLDRAGPEGLIRSTPAQAQHTDLVDWPPAERDNYVFTSVNTVVNAFHLRALELMRRLALALGRQADADGYARRESSTLAAFQSVLFDPSTGLYRDGLGTDHSSVHANLFPLAFGLVPPDERDHVAQWLAAQPMRVSVYAAQYLLEALFQNGQSTAALQLITAPGDRSWRHMVESGATITWEAWDQRYKPNQDWNHAWGAAPANLLPRFVLGVQPTQPAWSAALIQPHPGDLQFARGTVPTPRGTIHIGWHAAPRFTLTATLPSGIAATVRLPASESSTGVWSRGHPIPAHRDGPWWLLDHPLRGSFSLQVH